MGKHVQCNEVSERWLELAARATSLHYKRVAGACEDSDSAAWTDHPADKGAGSRHGGAPIHKSSMKRSMSDQSLRIQGRQPVNQDQIHRSMRRSGSEASLSTNLKGPPRIKTPKPRARASAATQQGAVAPSPAISSSSRFYARVVRTQQEYFGCAQGTNQLFCCDLHQQQACPEEVSRNQRRHGITTQQAMRMCDGA